MSEENKNMDDSFRKMNESFEASYDKSFWGEALAEIENEALDSAFREAAKQTTVVGGASLAAQGLGDAFMDEAFRDAASDVSVEYSSDYWAELDANRPTLEMDEAFFTASNNTKANYLPIYWGAANRALQQEGLHHEYNTAYWKEAKQLLDKQDRKVFFAKWTGVAVLLLMISFLGFNGDYISALKTENSSGFSPKMSGVNRVESNHDANQLVQNSADIINTNNDRNLQNSADNTSQNLERTAIDIATETNTDYGSLANTNETGSDTQTDLDATIPTVAINTNEIDSDTQTDLDATIPTVAINATEIDSDTQTDLDATIPIVAINTTEIDSDTQTDLDATIPTVAINTTETGSDIQTDSEANTLDGEDLVILNQNIERIIITPHKLNVQEKELPNNRLVEVVTAKIKPVIQFSYIGGAGLGNDYGTNETTLTKRFYTGFELISNGYGKLRNVEFGLSLRMNYNYMDGLESGGITTEFVNENSTAGVNYEGWSNRYWRNVKMYDLFYANANFLINYKLNTRNKIKLGVGIEKLIGVQSNMVYNLYDDKGYQIVNNNWGVTEGIEELDMRLSLGYEYQLTRRLGIQLSANYGLFDRTNNEIFQNNEALDGEQTFFDNEINMSIGLKYNLFTRIK